MKPNLNILNVENNREDCSLLTHILEQRRCQIITSRSAREGLEQALTKSFGAIILDLDLPETNGIELCKIIRTFDIRTPIIFYSAETRPIFVNAALNSGANNYLVKPKDFFVLIETVANTLKPALMTV